MTTASEKVDAESSSLLDTDIETDIWALGIAETSISTEVVGISYGPEDLIRTDAPQEEDDDVVAQSQFDFIHIRYKSSGTADGPRIFRSAFEQTKPGGWIEVVENSSSRCPTRSLDENVVGKGTITRMSNGLGTSKMALLIKQQLTEAGFVEVEEKVWRVSTSPWERVLGFGKFIFSLLSMRNWERDNARETKTTPFRPTAFVIARRP